MKRIAILPLLILPLLMACSKSVTETDKAEITVLLTDTPAEYEEVLIDVREVKINLTSPGNEGGWVELENINAGIYNLLDFTNGIDTVLGSQILGIGTISQIRLVLGENNSLKKNGTYYDLKAPSAQQSGLKINLHVDLIAGFTYRIWLDFDAARSIIEKGNGEYSLKPVIRAYTDELSGAIKGVIEPIEAKPYIFTVTSEMDTLGTFADTTNGHFLLGGLSAGFYAVEVKPLEKYQEIKIENINVSVGTISDLGVLTISEK